ncbi:flagellar biosynthesis protein FlgD [Buchnera aphidicola (Melanaphis sacchari)]|uniref:Basal-body rod modification protein FlgD n=1 Tax=Buchnera aphidicola (Melanaphis sacchari) TaxID=2173854 RepID=A0A2U8DG56_9GAMM|nr:flagellar hook assembly protein FlgD [Buchnera aphidicola]AWH90455.1 flagellar biosynthesis protein FlgD [Buchnera aphidicola (Melanaphis sacchari)]
MSDININPAINNNIFENNTNTSEDNYNALNLQKNFLSLLVAQIKNQDPTDPIKNSELTSQLAQINTASGIEKLNNTVGNFSYKIHQNQNIQVSSLIKHHVMIPRPEIIHTKDINTPFGIELFGNADSVVIKITDENKNVVHTKEIKNLTPGTYKFVWDGTDLNKKSAETGKYNVTVTAMNASKNVPAQVLTAALVNSIITSSGDPIIDLGAMGTTKLSQIRAILE